MKRNTLLSSLAALSMLLMVAVGCHTLVSCGGGGDDGGSGGGGDSGALPVYPASRTLAFPGADGGASNITGAAESTSSTVYVVSNLDDNGPGSFRDAVSQDNRTIVFSVAGVINLSNVLKISGKNLTIAGQTAPGGGITIAGWPVTITGSNIIMRFLRFRMGDQNSEKMTDSQISGADALNGENCSNILIDHCSISWSIDECASFYGMKNFTMQYCVISESLRNSIHDKGRHGYGGIWGGENASFHHNLLAHHDSRNPRFDHDYVNTLKGPVHYVNNVVYNWGGNSAYGGESAQNSTPKYINMVNNYYKPGPASSHTTRLLNPTTNCSNCNSVSPYTAVPGKFYITGNYMYGSSAVTSDNWAGVEPDDASRKSECKANSYAGTAHTYVESAADAFESVLKYAGASKSRDAIDVRIMGAAGPNGTGGEVRNGTATCTGSNGSTGGLIDTQTDAGGYPDLDKGTAYKDLDKDGMDDDWEEAKLKELGVTGKTRSDFRPNAYNLSRRYTNLEVFCNSLVTQTFPTGAGASDIMPK